MRGAWLEPFQRLIDRQAYSINSRTPRTRSNSLMLVPPVRSDGTCQTTSVELGRRGLWHMKKMKYGMIYGKS